MTLLNFLVNNDESISKIKYKRLLKNHRKIFTGDHLILSG